MNRGGSRWPTSAEVDAVHGGHPHGPDDRALAQVELATIRTLAAASGLGALVVGMEDALRRDPMHQVWARIVDRTGRSYDEVAGYSDEALAFELAREILTAEDRAERCPDCGTRPSEVLDPETFKPLEAGRWQWVLHTCEWCNVGRRAERGLSEDDREAGARFLSRPRPPGAQGLVDDGEADG